MKWDQISISSTIISPLNWKNQNQPTQHSESDWVGFEIACEKAGIMAKWQALCPKQIFDQIESFLR